MNPPLIDGRRIVELNIDRWMAYGIGFDGEIDGLLMAGLVAGPIVGLAFDSKLRQYQELVLLVERC